MKKAVFFDRDGTLIIDKIYLNDPNDIEYLPGVFEGMRKLQEAGYAFVIVTNQSGVPRGLVQLENLEQIHKNIATDLAKHEIEVLDFYYAPHLVESNHHLRKPNPGMLEKGIEAFDIDPKQSWMVGDRMTDVEAGRRASTRTVFLEGTEDPKESPFEAPDFIAKDFNKVVEFILSST